MEKKHSNTIVKSQGIPDFALKELKKLMIENHKNKYVLEIDDIDKVYDNGFQAIFGTSLRIKKGEFFALLGPSGCGKTTTLRMVAGLESVTQGGIYINDVDVTTTEPSSRNLTMVFQNYALFPHLSVKNNITFGLKANKKKLGKGGEIYKKIQFMENKHKSVNVLINDLNHIDSYEKEFQKNENKIINLEDKIKSSKSDKKKKQLSTKIVLVKNINDKLEIKISNLKSDHHNLAKYVKDNNELKEEIESMRKLFSQVAKEDNYSDLIEKKLKYASDMLGLEYYLDRKPAALSGGQRQRVALGRSIVGNPTLFLMDEPLSNLDAKLRASMRKQIRELHDKINSATIYVTHDQVEAMTMADKVVVMSDGFVQQVGSPKNVFQNPANLFVATFVGTPTMNTFSGSIKKGVFTSDSGTKFKVMPSKLKNVIDGQRVVLGLRPSDITTEKIVNDTYKSHIQVKITFKELLGNEIQYSAETIGKKKEKITFVLSSYEDYEVGKKISIYPISSRIHLFDEKTTISLTSKFNLETLQSLKNWSVSSDKIEARRAILEKSKKKAQKKSLIKRLLEKRA